MSRTFRRRVFFGDFTINDVELLLEALDVDTESPIEYDDVMAVDTIYTVTDP